MMRLAILSVALLGLMACGETPPDDRVTPIDRALPGPSEGGGGGDLAEVELCDAQDYRILVGTDIADTTFPQGANLRVFGVNDIVTQDYIPQRTNVVFDTSRKVVRVYCG